jgi:hypothetical protein
MIGHHDDDHSYPYVPDELKRSVRQEILRFGAVEMAKLLFYVDDYGFDRPSSGYSLMAIFGARVDSREIIAGIRDDPAVDQKTRDKAAWLIAMEQEDPNWFKWWRKDEK